MGNKPEGGEGGIRTLVCHSASPTVSLYKIVYSQQAASKSALISILSSRDLHPVNARELPIG